MYSFPETSRIRAPRADSTTIACSGENVGVRTPAGRSRRASSRSSVSRADRGLRCNDSPPAPPTIRASGAAVLHREQHDVVTPRLSALVPTQHATGSHRLVQSASRLSETEPNDASVPEAGGAGCC